MEHKKSVDNGKDEGTKLTAYVYKSQLTKIYELQDHFEAKAGTGFRPSLSSMVQLAIDKFYKTEIEENN